ncbi:hypothetical protein GCM10010404_73380 [Nonomuraea africana]
MLPLADAVLELPVDAELPVEPFEEPAGEPGDEPAGEPGDEPAGVDAEPPGAVEVEPPGTAGEVPGAEVAAEGSAVPPAAPGVLARPLMAPEPAPERGPVPGDALTFGDGVRETKSPPPALGFGVSSFATAAQAVVEAASTAAPRATVVQRRLPGAVRRPRGFRRDGLLEC